MKNRNFLVFVFASTLLSGVGMATDNGAANDNAELAQRVMKLEQQIRALKNPTHRKCSNLASHIEENQLFDYAHGPVVVTSPYLGVRRPDDDSSNLMVNLSSMNQDLVLLRLRQKLDSYSKERGLVAPMRPIIALSGGLEGKFTTDSNNKYSSTSKSDLNLSMAELDIIAKVNPWTTAAMIVAYDDDREDGKTKAGSSRIYLNRGWFTFGDLSRLPFYATIGQLYAPFGSYSSNRVSTSSTKKLGRVEDRMVVVGYASHGAYAQLYGYAGETKLAKSKEVTDHSGFNIGYKYGQDNFTLDLGAGYLGNLAESEELLNNLFTPESLKQQPLNSRVGALNLRAKAAWERFSVLAEYVGALKRFNPADLKFNEQGAKPQSLNLEGAFEFMTLGKASSVFAGYETTSQALALGVPKQSFFAGYTIAPLKYTLVSLEYRHDIDYSWNDRMSNSVRSTASSRHNNVISMQLGVYF